MESLESRGVGGESRRGVGVGKKLAGVGKEWDKESERSRKGVRKESERGVGKKLEGFRGKE